MTPQDQLRELIRGKGMTIVDLSRQSGVSRATIARFLRGEAVGSDKLQAIATALHCNIRFIQK